MADDAPAPALVPLSLLEAIRNLDTPVDDGLDELAAEVVARRLGLSGTVAAQIARYQQAAERGAGVPRDEAVQVFRLVGRRADAALAYADAGRRAARHAVRLRGGSARTLQRVTPDPVGRRLGQRAAARIARDVFGAELRFRAGAGSVRLAADALALEAQPDGEACAFYTAAFAELLRLLLGFEGAVLHEHCRGQGAETDLWRTAATDGDYG